MNASSVVGTLRVRWVRAGHLDYPAWVPLAMDGCAFGSGIIAVLQRVGDHPLVPVVALMALALAPWVADLGGWAQPWQVFTALVVGATTVLMVLFPMEYDFALFVLIMMAGHLGATVSITRSGAATALAAAALVVMEATGQFAGSAFWLAAVVTAWDVGVIMQYLQRRLEEQSATHAAREAQVALEERQRIAREVHDVIAHSLSVTMLHLTAARRALEEDGEAEVSETVEALRDAERLGRQSMVDIRRTVGLLGSGGPSSDRPAPDVASITALIEEFRAAGLDVTYEVRGDLGEVSTTNGLGLYRILQESMANVAKHQPDGVVRVRLDLEKRPCRLSVWNSLGSPTPTRDHGGSGLRGMHERARLLGGELSAGPSDEGWLVELEFPSDRADPTWTCPWRASTDTT